MAKMIKIYPENPNERGMREVVECLQSGGIVIYPTDTVYGVGCDIFNVKAIEKLCAIKDITFKKSTFSFICSDLSQASGFIKPLDNHLFKIIKANTPGPFTFILNASNNVPKHIQSKRKTLGIRIPEHSVPLEIVRILGNPIMSSSVHDEEDEILEYSTDPELIKEKYEHKVDLVIDCGFGDITPSAIVDCTDGDINILREGKKELHY